MASKTSLALFSPFNMYGGGEHYVCSHLVQDTHDERPKAHNAHAAAVK